MHEEWWAEGGREVVVDASMYLQAVGEGGQKSTHQVICSSDWMHHGCGENAEAVGIDALHANSSR